jgi:hypothetical protein
MRYPERTSCMKCHFVPFHNQKRPSENGGGRGSIAPPARVRTGFDKTREMGSSSRSVSSSPVKGTVPSAAIRIESVFLLRNKPNKLFWLV